MIHNAHPNTKRSILIILCFNIELLTQKKQTIFERSKVISEEKFRQKKITL